MTNIPSNPENATRFVKIPKAILCCTPREARLYAAFLDFKAWNPEGVILESSMVLRRSDCNYYKYWMNQLLSCKWATEVATPKGRLFRLKSYQEIWRGLGVRPSWCRSLKKYKFIYTKVDIQDLPLERNKYTKLLKDLLLSQVARNKVRQIKYRLRSTQSPETDKTATYISARTIARLFGLKSSRSGQEYRKKFFEVIAEPKVLLKFRDGSCRYMCKRIAL